MPSSKTPQEILDELGELGELYALPKTLNGFSDVVATNSENGLQYRAMRVNKDLHNYFRSSMQSLLLHVMGEMPHKYDGDTDYEEGRNVGIDDCLAVIQSTIDSIKE